MVIAVLLFPARAKILRDNVLFAQKLSQDGNQVLTSRDSGFARLEFREFWVRRCQEPSSHLKVDYATRVKLILN